jgi:pantoate--beta-alanine ligase
MLTVTTIAELRGIVRSWRRYDERIAFVPTMGNLHDGHLRLVKEAKARADRVVVSIFVNPMQFTDASGAGGDFARYPRTPAQDSELLASGGADLLFTPATEEVYPAGFGQTTRVEVPGISDILCGAFRPGHFTGVATVVAKLFNMVQPDVALFGEKDCQQLLVIRRLAKELCFPVEIIGVPTVRELSGLAMSSRNQYLTAEERERAALLYQTLSWMNERIKAGEGDFPRLETEATQRLQDAGFRPEYISVRRAADLQLPAEHDTHLVILAAAWLGSARLIDNLQCNR